MARGADTGSTSPRRSRLPATRTRCRTGTADGLSIVGEEDCVRQWPPRRRLRRGCLLPLLLALPPAAEEEEEEVPP